MVYTLYQRHETFGGSPSDSIGLQDTWWRYQFDNAVFVFGRIVSNRVNERDSKGRPVMTLEEAMGLPREDELTVMNRKLAEAQRRGRQLRKELGLIE